MTVILVVVVVVMRYGDDDDDARTGFDTAYMVTNEETTGLLSYVGEKHTTVQYDQTLYQVSSLDISGDDKFSVVSHIMIFSVEHDGGQQPRHPRHVLLRRVQPPDRQAHVARDRGLRVQQQTLHPRARPQLV